MDSNDQTVIPIASKPFGDFTLKILLTDDPVTLDKFVTHGHDLTEDVFVVTSQRMRISTEYGIDERLGLECPFCKCPLKFSASEFNNRIFCSCTMVLFPLLDPNDPSEEEGTLVGPYIQLFTGTEPPMWRTLIEQSQAAQDRHWGLSMWRTLLEQSQAGIRRQKVNL